MRRSVTTLCLVCLALSPSGAFAVGGGAVRITLSTGVASSTASEKYGGLVVLPNWALAGAGGVGMRVAGPLLDTFDVSYFRIGRGQIIGRTIWVDPVMEPTNVLAGMVGLELTAPDRAAPFVSGSIGFGRVSVGDMKNYSMSGAMITSHTDPEVAPAFSLGLGVRAGSASSPLRPVIGIRWVSVLANGGSMNFVPATFGLGF